MSDCVRIGNAQAFWGDLPSAAKELLAQVPELDYLTMDYLAEVSMSILAIQRDRDPSKGYAQDFVEVVRGLSPYWTAGGRCRLIVNAGGLNPMGCAVACQATLEQSGCRSLKIAVVHGDDVLAMLQQSDGTESHAANLDTGQSIDSVRERLLTANAYTGCAGIVEALSKGADIVITGRVADPSMVMGAFAHHFNIALDDWDALAGATVAGHLLECGTHATGGISTDWLEVPDPTDIGFPIAELARDGSCVIAKGPGTGGRVTIATIKEQLLYEISDPNRYISPDVIVSFLKLGVVEVGRDRVAVRGAIGSPRPETLKVSATYRDGYRAAGMLTILGPDAVSKARRCGEMVLRRLDRAGWQYRDRIVELLGANASVPVYSSELNMDAISEIVLRIAVDSDSKAAVEAFTKEMSPLVTAGPQGTTGYAEGRPALHPVVRYWPCLIPAERIGLHVEALVTRDTRADHSRPPVWPPRFASGALSHDAIASCVHPPTDSKSRTSVEHSSKPARTAVGRLRDIAFGRSGDKGMNANIGILARDPGQYEALRLWLTIERVLGFFQPMGVARVDRYEVPNLHGLNFVVHGILKRSIRNDAQGKALAQALLSMPLVDFDAEPQRD
ncbi:MAG: acyclic terpene utilization AtuA family protein [Pirellula sp.]